MTARKVAKTIRIQTRMQRSQACALHAALARFIDDGGLYDLVLRRYGEAVDDYRSPGLAVARYFTLTPLATPADVHCLSEARSQCRKAREAQVEAAAAHQMVLGL